MIRFRFVASFSSLINCPFLLSLFCYAKSFIRLRKNKIDDLFVELYKGTFYVGKGKAYLRAEVSYLGESCTQAEREGNINAKKWS